MATVLVVDDDADVLQTVATIIRRAGHTVIEASSAIGALKVLDPDIAVDLMVTDIMMPGLNGFNLARMARQKRHRLKILYLTGYADQAAVLSDAGEQYGKLLNKPILPPDLRREVAQVLACELC